MIHNNVTWKRPHTHDPLPVVIHNRKYTKCKFINIYIYVHDSNPDSGMNISEYHDALTNQTL